MIWLAAIAALSPPADFTRLPGIFVGRYYSDLSTKYRSEICSGKIDDFNITIKPDTIRIRSHSFAVLYYENVDNNDIHVWVKGDDKEVSLFHLSLQSQHHVIVVVSEIDEARELARAPGTIDAGVLGTFRTC